MSENDAPNLQNVMIIGENPHLIAQISSLLAVKNHYLPVVEPPRLSRPDAHAEIAQRVNLAARYNPKIIILADTTNDIKSCFGVSIPKNIIETIDKIEDLVSNQRIYTNKEKQKFYWSNKNIGIGLLEAMKQNKEIVFTETNNSSLRHNSCSNHLVICEEGNELAQVIAANYAFSIGADLFLIPKIPEDVENDICETFYNSDNLKYTNQTICLENIKIRLRELSPDIPTKNRSYLTFITNLIPWGFSYSEIPSTHIFSYPAMGISILNAIISEKSKSNIQAYALIIDPELVASSEADKVASNLTNNHMITKVLRGNNADVFNASINIYNLPYDFLLISTHCGDAPGWRSTYEFIDSENIERTLVIDETIGVAEIPSEKDKLEVMSFIRFISLDGIDWNDPIEKEKLYVGKAIIDFTERSENNLNVNCTSKENIQRVPSSATLRMSDNNLILVPQHTNNNNYPIILNNACYSWHRLAADFIYTGARAYIGTLFPVLDAIANEIALKLTNEYAHLPLALSLWKAQNDIYGQNIKRPYILTGPHFQKFNFDSNDKVDLILERLMQNHKLYEEVYKEASNDMAKRRIHEILTFLANEAKSIIIIKYS